MGRLQRVAVAMIVASSCGLLAPVAGAATASQVGKQLRAWHLHPAPLFPAHLSRGFRGASAMLDHEGFDYNVNFQRSASVNGTVQPVLLVSLRRGGPRLLDQVLHDPRVSSYRRVRAGHRRVFLVHANKLAVVWHEQGRTYLVISKYGLPSTGDLKRFVGVLQRL